MNNGLPSFLKVYFKIFNTNTTNGTCILVWHDSGLCRILLTNPNHAKALEELSSFFPHAKEGRPPDKIVVLEKLITNHLEGNLQNFSDIALDMSSLTPFRQKVYTTLRKIQYGTYISYKELAELVRAPKAARAIGQAMAHNPFPLVVPCHRVLTSQKNLGGFSAHGGLQTKVNLLALEGVLLPGKTLGLEFEPQEAIEYLKKKEPRFIKLFDQVGPFRLLVDAMESPFVALVKSIIYQQLTGKAAHSILQRLRNYYDGHIPEPRILQSQDVETLKSIGLSRNKAEALKDLATQTTKGVVPTLQSLKKMNEESIIERLTSVRGIGRWSVEMLLIFRLGRPDVFPAGDYGVRKGLTYLLQQEEIIKPRQALQIAENWGPFRTLASWYLWRAAELGPDFFLPSCQSL